MALDVGSTGAAVALARRLEPHVGGFKVGLELLMNDGPGVVSEVATLGKPVFCDAKLHDIPQTVERSARALARHGARWVSVHAAGGRAMLAAAVAGGGETGILAITVLTSLSGADLTATGISANPIDQVRRMAAVAAAAGAEGVVCSAREAAALRGAGLRIFIPGIRTPGTDRGDQVRVATPIEALDAGADFLVVGRAVTAAANPVAAAAAIYAEIAAWQGGGPVESVGRTQGGTMEPPQISDEQRAAALKKAGEARRVRAEVKELLKTGSLSFPELIERAADDPLVGGLKVGSVLASMPGTGKIKAKRLMEAHGIADNRRLRGLGDRQRAALLSEFS